MHDFHIYRRKLPHWRAEGATYFVTWRIHHGQTELTESERTLVVSALWHFNDSRYRLHAFVVMNDHVHVLTTLKPCLVLESVVRSWKSFTANRMQKDTARLGSVWQDEYMDRIIRNEAEFIEKAQYILNNPRKRWPEITEYPWVGHEGETKS